MCLKVENPFLKVDRALTLCGEPLIILDELGELVDKSVIVVSRMPFVKCNLREHASLKFDVCEDG